MRDRLKSLLFILILGSVCTGLLLGIRAYTLPIIKDYQATTLKRTILDAANIDFDESNLKEVFEKNIRKIEHGGFEYYLSPDNLHIFEFVGRGLWGMIEGVIALEENLKTIRSMKIVSQEETPGLGGRISESSFMDQFRGKEIFPKLSLAMRKKADKPTEIDAITGATMTSQALLNILNESAENFRGKIKGR